MIPIIASYPPIQCLPLALCLLSGTSALGQSELFIATSGGSIEQRDPNNGALLATGIGGITNARGITLGPSSGLFVARGQGVDRVTAAGLVHVVTYVGEVPHDLAFDDRGWLHVVTSVRVHIYDRLGVQVLEFPHGLTTTGGNGNNLKGWSIAVNPISGDIFVAGEQGIRYFDATSGALVGSLTPQTAYGVAGLAFTPLGVNGAYLYAGSVHDGRDRINVYDANLTFLRTFSTPAHIGNPIDFEVDPLTGDLFVANTVSPVDRYSRHETLLVAGIGGPARSLAFRSTGAMVDQFLVPSDDPAGRIGIAILAPEVRYRVIVEGTVSYWAPVNWASGTPCGSPEPLPIHPSASGVTGPVGADPAWIFAAQPGDLLCAGPLPLRRDNVGFDVGGGVQLLSPFQASYSTTHTYEYDLVGQGRPLRVRVEDAPHFDNYGQLSVSVFESPGVIGARYCAPSHINSTGKSGLIDAIGSNVVSLNDVVLSATHLPSQAFGMFLASRTTASTPNPGGSAGVLCLGGSIGRYVGPGQIQNSGITGAFALRIDLGQVPTPTGALGVTPGVTWSFQAWFRDANPTVTSDFTDAVSITFQ
jgi:hypothetical protein